MSVLAGRTPAALAEMFERPLDALDWMEKVTVDSRANGFDATDWLYQSWAYQAHDVGTTPGYNGETNAALESIKDQAVRAKACVLRGDLDGLTDVLREGWKAKRHLASGIATAAWIRSSKARKAA